MQPRFWGYAFGFLFITVLGAFVQIKYMPELDVGDDKVEEENEGKTALLTYVERPNANDLL